jgi:imidazolonepropionase-like amidohydrolase
VPRSAADARLTTSAAARVPGTGRIGAILPGRAANLVVVVGEPRDDMRAAPGVIMVFRVGRHVVDRRGE